MQKNINLHLSQDKIVRATAGAGKTTKLIDDVCHTYLSHKSEYNRSPRILLTTFTVKAANELSERLFSKAIEIADKEFLNYCLSSYLEIGTMHSVFSALLSQLDQSFSQNEYVSYSYKLHCAKGFFVKLVEENNLLHLFSEPYDFNETLNFFLYLERSKFTYTFLDKNKILEEAKKEALVYTEESEALFKILKKTENFSDFETVLNQLDPKLNKDLLVFLKKENNKEYFIEKFYSYNKKISELYREWSERFGEFVQEKGLYTLEDMEPLILELSKNKNLASRWDYCFFDEYQDTSPEQKELIDRFCSQSTKYYVGDPFQSIYFFRGARKEIFDDEFNRIKNENLNIEYKTTSYRSAKNIVNFVNHVSNGMFSDFDSITPHKTEDGKVRVAFFEDQTIEEEIDFLTDELKGLDPKDVLILSRQTKNLSKAFKRLKLKGFSALPLFGSGVADHLKSFELISFLQFLEDQKNDESLKVILFSEVYNFSDKELANFIRGAAEKKHSLWEEVRGDSRLSLLKSLAENKSSYGQALRVFVSESGFISQSRSNNKDSLKEFNCFKILQSLEEEEKKLGFNIKAFCDDLLTGRYPFGKESVEESNSFKLMTVHGSKGLEAKHVFILGANQGYRDLDNYPLFFDEKSKTSAAKVKDKNLNRSLPFFHQSLIEREKDIKKEENRRLFYVAMTRAEVDLYIIGSGKKEKSPSEPSWMSHVLNALGDDALAFVEFVDMSCVQKNSKIEQDSEVKWVDFFKNTKPLVSKSDEKKDLQEYQKNDLHALSYNIKRGIDFHAYMEGNLQGGGEEYKSALDYLNNQVEFPFAQIFESGYKEWGYDWFNSDTGKIESGKIDIWAEIDETVWIIDYKTGSLSGVDKGFEQLERYKKVLSEYLKGDKKFVLVLTFPFNQKTLLKS